MDTIRLQKLLYKVKNCGSYYMLHKLEEDFNSVGFTIQKTLKDNHILCRIVEGEPATEIPMEDYVFIGSVNESTKEVPGGIMDSIINFIVENASESTKLNMEPKINRNGFYTYGRIMVVNEEVNKIAQNIIMD